MIFFLKKKLYLCAMFMFHNRLDTICAVCTPSGEGAIAVIRISGGCAFAVCERVLAFKNSWDRRRGLARIMRGSEVIDEVLALGFQAPRSYTGEDVVEIFCHGSQFIQQEILKLLLENGCRLATGGEFTQRAFFNGKLDLSQAEAVGDLIAAKSAASHRVAMLQMRGGISCELSALSEKLLEFVSLVELELDFSEEDVEFADRAQLQNLAQQIAAVIRRLADSFGAGNAIKNGIHVAIAGKTNVGKSTLLNRLLRDEKAIVSDTHGTTRDAIEDTVTIDGLLFRFTDTAGIRATSDAIEKLGIERSFQKIEKAAITLWVIDLTEEIYDFRTEFENQKSKIEKSKIENQKSKIILTLNKSDLLSDEERKQKTAYYSGLHDDCIVISAHSDADISLLERKLVEKANIPHIGANDVIVTNLRHYEALTHALSAIERVIEGLEAGLTSDFLSQDIRECLSHLNEITGKQISAEDVLGNIFRNFCIGK